MRVFLSFSLEICLMQALHPFLTLKSTKKGNFHNLPKFQLLLRASNQARVILSRSPPF